MDLASPAVSGTSVYANGLMSLFKRYAHRFRIDTSYKAENVI